MDKSQKTSKKSNQIAEKLSKHHYSGSSFNNSNSPLKMSSKAFIPTSVNVSKRKVFSPNTDKSIRSHSKVSKNKGNSIAT